MEMEELSVNLSGLDGEVQDVSKMLEATHSQVVANTPLSKKGLTCTDAHKDRHRHAHKLTHSLADSHAHHATSPPGKKTCMV
jgi:hypothetical protein